MKSLAQMTEKELRTLCKSLEAEYGENSTVTIKQSDFNKMWASIDRYAKENKRLQEQLEEANEVIESLRTYDFTVDDENAEEYQVKWNVEAKRFYKNKKRGVK